MRAGLLFLLLAPVAAGAQTVPGDSRIQSIDYVPGRIFRVEAAPGYQVMIELAADEHIETVSLGDSGAWQVTSNRRGDRLFIKPTLAGVTTNMLVTTDTRLYNFELAPGSSTGSAWTLNFRYPGTAAQNAEAAVVEDKVVGRYKLRGDRTLLPSGMHDDGIHTYVEWREDQALPAIYAVNDQGREMLVNGMMRDGRMVIDSIQNQLVFRIDNHKAQAVRVIGKP